MDPLVRAIWVGVVHLGRWPAPVLSLPCWHCPGPIAWASSRSRRISLGSVQSPAVLVSLTHTSYRARDIPCDPDAA